MSELLKRSVKYYITQGFKTIGYVGILYLILIVEWVLLDSGTTDSLIEDTFSRLIFMGGGFVILMNLMFSLYGPNWYDSLVLSMGARRRDVFLGEIIKQLVFVICNSIILMVATFFTGDMGNIKFVLVSAFIALIMGPIGIVIGYKIKTYGKVVIIVIALTVGGMAGFTTVGLLSGAIVFAYINVSQIIYIILGVLAYIGFEYWAYKLNQKSMVK